MQQYQPDPNRWQNPVYPVQPPYFAPPPTPEQVRKQKNRFHRKEYNKLGYSLFLQMGVATAISFLMMFFYSFTTVFQLMQKTGGGIPPYQLIQRVMANVPLWMVPVASAVSMLAANLAASLTFLRPLRLDVKDMFRWKGTTAGLILGGAAASLAVNYGAGLLMNLLNAVLGQVHLQMTTPDLGLQYDASGNLAMLVYVVLIAPVTEELLVRGVFLRTLQRTGRWFAIVISSMLFALIHGNFLQAVPAFCVGVVLGYVAMRAGSILPTILIHVLNNSYVMLLDSMTGRWQSAASVIEVTVIIIAAAGALIALWRERGNFSLIGERKAAPGSVGLVFTSWAVLANVIFYGGMMLFSVRIV